MIEILERTEPQHMRMMKDPRCECPTNSHGSYYFKSSNSQCARFAAYKVDGVNLCKQHAGDKLLSDQLKLLHVPKQRGGS